MTRVSLHHLTSYHFDRPVQIHPHSIRLRPAPHTRAHVHSYSLKVSPEHFINWQQDPAGNFLARLVFPEKSWELEQFPAGAEAQKVALASPENLWVETDLGGGRLLWTVRARPRRELAKERGNKER